MDKKILAADVCGVGFVAAGSLFMQQLYGLSGHELIGILFGSVNNSIWEMCKTLLLPYLVWTVLEILSVRVSLYRFTVAKTASLYLLGATYILLRLLSVSQFAAAAISVCAAFALAQLLYCSPMPLRGLFAPAIVLLFLFVSLYFSLTPFPLQNEIFRDSATGMYGLIPDHLDYGAIALDAMAKL